MQLLELFQSQPAYSWIAVAGFGLILGSFLNVVITRLPVMLNHQWRIMCQDFLANAPAGMPHAQKESFNLAFPNSHCPHCKANISFYDNIPLLSFLWLRGQCRHCKASISWQYPVIELTTMLIWLLAFQTHGFAVGALVLGVVLSTLLALTVIDLKTLLLPDELTLPLMWFCLLMTLFNTGVTPQDAMIGATAGYLSLWSVYWVFKLLTGKEGMGYGDFKLLAAIGAWLGWQALPIVIFLSALVGLAVGVGLILFQNHSSDKAIPFGPYLALAAVLDAFYHDAIITFYWRWFV